MEWEPRLADFDNDGWPDIYVACDTAPSLLYRNNHDGTFREIGVPAGVAFDENGVRCRAWASAYGDYDGDGWLDIARTNFSDQVTTLYRNNANGTFHDASLAAGMGINRKYLGFGAVFLDFDNDGWKDLFLANGHVYAQIAGTQAAYHLQAAAVLYQNRGREVGRCVAEGRSGIIAAHVDAAAPAATWTTTETWRSWSTTWTDVRPRLRYEGATGTIAVCSMRRNASNRSAIGARVTVTAGGRKQIDEVMSGSSYYSQNDLRLHFGLGGAATADLVEIRWPSGGQEKIENVPANQFITIREGAGIVARQQRKNREGSEMIRLLLAFIAAVGLLAQSQTSGANAANDAGVEHLRRNEFVDAIAAFRKAVKADPKFVRAWNNLGSALAQAGDMQDSVDAFKRAVALAPQDLQLRMNLESRCARWEMQMPLLSNFER